MDDPGAVRFETAEVLRLFPVFVWKAQLAAEVCRPINAAIRALLAKLAPGAPADVTVLDPQKKRAVDPKHFASKGRNTPFAGWTLKGWPVMTIVGGKVVWRDGRS